MKQIRLSPTERQKMIVAAIRAEAAAVGKLALTHEGVAARCEIETSVATVRFYFRTMAALREVVENVEP